MATTNTTPTPDPQVNSSSSSVSADDLTAKAIHKHYEQLIMVRNEAIEGKGDWYWAHLHPILLHNTDTGLPKAVHLRCSLCDSVFPDSNPSFIASEHLKSSTCPNFNSSMAGEW